MNGAPDQTVQILLKTVADLKDGELTIRQQRELQKAIEATGRGAELPASGFYRGKMEIER